MAEIRQDLFGDGTVSMEHYEHQRIILRVAGFKIVVNKPYRTKIYNGATLDSPSIQMSTNSTVMLDLNDLKLINKSILKAIDILNNENDSFKIDKNFRLSNNIVPAIPLETDKTKKNTIKSIPYAEIKYDKVYMDAKGHKWIYLGVGWLYENGQRRNRSNNGVTYSKYIYIDYDELCKHVWEQQYSTIISKGGICLIDSYATKKRFVAEVDKLVNRVFCLTNGHSQYNFEPIK